jgi:signal transduction histidine kinase
VLQRALAYQQLYVRLEEQRTLLACENEASMEGILVLSAAGRVVSSNRRFRDLWGFDPSAPGSILFGGAAAQVKDPEGFLSRVAYLQKHPEVVSSEEVALKDGRTFERYVAPICSEDGTYFGQGWYFRDVTARKEVDANRRLLLQREHAARTSAEEEVRKRDEFLSIAAHELRTPLTPLALRLNALVRRARTGAPVCPEALEKAQESLRKVTVLVSDLLDFSRIESGRMVLRQLPCRLDLLLPEVVSDIRMSSADHTFELQLSGEATVAADTGRLEQVFSNLLDNAVKYSPAGGRVRVTLSLVQGEAICSVSDEGIGIPREDQVGLFDRFFRARNAPTSNFSGLGLGLYITREIVRGHGGRIWVQSEVGKGATFFVALPLIMERAVEPRG